jgi:3-carboxy-cis,cis-muconate cycloisomerase
MTPFELLYVPEPLLAAVGDRAWLEAMLEAEKALATAESKAGVIPPESAARIAEQCRAELYDPEGLAREAGRAAGNPAEALVRALRERVGGEAARHVHWGATSQDVMDTASMLVARRALDLVMAEIDRAAAGIAALAETHRSTPMVARTLLQQAVPTTFGCKAAGWLVSVLDARRRLREVRADRLAAELGGAGGTLAVLGERGPEVLRLYAAELGLPEPVVPWHTNRTRIAELAGALDTAAGVMAKIGLDLALLAQTEVGEVREGSGGGSSTLPQKRNPVRSTLARACASLVSGYASTLARAVVQEHERAAGAWHAEWPALSGALAYAGGAAAAVADAVEGLEVDGERMRRNLELTEGLILAERVSFALAAADGSGPAHDVVRDVALRASASGRTFEDELRADGRVALTSEELSAALDPTTYLGSAEQFVDRALDYYRTAQAEDA